MIHKGLYDTFVSIADNNSEATAAIQEPAGMRTTRLILFRGGMGLLCALFLLEIAHILPGPLFMFLGAILIFVWRTYEVIIAPRQYHRHLRVYEKNAQLAVLPKKLRRLASDFCRHTGVPFPPTFFDDIPTTLLLAQASRDKMQHAKTTKLLTKLLDTATSPNTQNHT